MNEKRHGVVSLASEFVNTQLFAGLFSKGMALVEETADYLDKAGRQDAKKLDRDHAVRYATSSMRLTTLLMSIASWLLLTRAFKENDLTIDEFKRDRKKIQSIDKDYSFELDGLPEKLVDLCSRALGVYSEIRRIDGMMKASGIPAPQNDEPQGARAQQLLLKTAFEPRG